jgi:hypothetical protein
MELRMKSNTFIKSALVTALVLAAISIYWFSNKSGLTENQPLAREVAPRSATALPATNRQKDVATTTSLSPPVNASATDSSYITYRPGQLRATREVFGAKDANGLVSRKLPNWRLYATSEAEAQWLDQFGYPTPGEEAKLKSSTDEELAALVKRGDLNAKSHQASRLALKAFAEGHANKASASVGTFSDLMLEGGPYQAMIARSTYHEILDAYYRFPASEQTPQLKAILKEWSREAEVAYAIGFAYSDGQSGQFQSRSSIGEQLGLTDMKDMSATSLGTALGRMSEVRVARGLPPITLVPRPSQPGMSLNGVGPIVLERY